MVTRDKPVYELNLPHVRFSDSLPPICKFLKTTTPRFCSVTAPLLHQASASCGRVITFLCLTLFLLTFTACEKEIPADDAFTRSAQQNDSTARGGLGIVVTIDTVDHGVGSTDHFLKFLYYTSFLTPHDPTSKFST